MRKYTHITQKEREKIHYLYHVKNQKLKEIGKEIGKHASTIGRELERNKTMVSIENNNNPQAKKNRKNWHYLPHRAEKKYLQRRKESKKKSPFENLELHEYVIEKLRIGWSPERITGRAKKEGIGKTNHESIYQYIYNDPRGKELELWKFLPRAQRKRKKRTGRKMKRTLIPNRIGIEQRPIEVEDRKEFGHWEGDSVLGVGKKSALNTNRERKTRKIMITKIRRKTAEETRKAVIRRFRNLPFEARKTNTKDNGCEFTEHEKITKKLGMKIYFANPYHSWERGTNENGNGLIRRFFPKKTDFNEISVEAIKFVEDWINNLPMKCLDYQTPNEAFQNELLKIYQLPKKNCT